MRLLVPCALLLLSLSLPCVFGQFEPLNAVGDFLRRAINFYCVDDFMICPNGGKTWRTWNNNLCQFTPCEFVAPNKTLLQLVRTNDSLFHQTRPSSWFGKTDFVVSAPRTRLMERARRIDDETVRMWQWKKNVTSWKHLKPDLWLALDVYVVNDRMGTKVRFGVDGTHGDQTGSHDSSAVGFGQMAVDSTITFNKTSEGMTQREFELLHSSAPTRSASSSLTEFTFPSEMAQYTNYSLFANSIDVTKWLLDHIEQKEFMANKLLAVSKLPTLVVGANKVVTDQAGRRTDWLFTQETNVQVAVWRFIRDFVYNLATVDDAALAAGLSMEHVLSYPIHPESISVRVFVTDYEDVLDWEESTLVLNVTKVVCERLSVLAPEAAMLYGFNESSRNSMLDCSCWLVGDSTRLFVQRANDTIENHEMVLKGLQFCDAVIRPRANSNPTS